MLYVVGLMAHLAPWLLGDRADWSERSQSYRARYGALRPNGIDPATFDGRGVYGAYFQSHARSPARRSPRVAEEAETSLVVSTPAP